MDFRAVLHDASEAVKRVFGERLHLAENHEHLRAPSPMPTPPPTKIRPDKNDLWTTIIPFRLYFLNFLPPQKKTITTAATCRSPPFFFLIWRTQLVSRWSSNCPKRRLMFAALRKPFWPNLRSLNIRETRNPPDKGLSQTFLELKLSQFFFGVHHEKMVNFLKGVKMCSKMWEMILNLLGRNFHSTFSLELLRVHPSLWLEECSKSIANKTRWFFQDHFPSRGGKTSLWNHHLEKANPQIEILTAFDG